MVEALTRITAMRGHPATIKVDNGSEFISKAMDRWAYEHGVELDFSRPGTPTDNAKVESFNGRFRAGMSERTLVLVIGRRAEQNRRLAHVL